MKTMVLSVLLVALFPVLRPATVAAEPPSYLQVVAHADDDVLFMNPTLGRSIRSGAAVSTVFVTAGESDRQPAADYAAMRQEGAHAAFAAMARARNDWQRTLLMLPGDRIAEWHRLRGTRVSLVFLGLPDDNDPMAVGGRHAMDRLWSRPGTRVNTIPAAGSGISPSTYDRSGVLEALRWLRKWQHAMVVRTLDPAPDPRFQLQWGRFHDHPDHVSTARFVTAVISGTRLECYRAYNIADTPANLSAAETAAKRAVFARYAPHDPEVSLQDPYASWFARMRTRDC